MTTSTNKRRKFKASNGIVDYVDKKKALEGLTGATNHTELAKCVLGTSASESAIDKLVQSFGKYHDHSPTGHVGRSFVKGVERYLLSLGSTAVNINGIFMHAPYGAFYEAIPPRLRDVVPVPEGETRSGDKDAFHHAWFMRDGVIETVKTGFAKGRIDHKLYYLSPDAAEIWRQVIDARKYPQYEDCVQSYEVLVKLPIWTDFFTAQSTDGVVMLGGGSATKDKIAIRSILSLTDRVLHYALVDYSNPMMTSTFAKVDTMLRHDRLSSRVKAEPVCCDFMQMPRIAGKLRRPGKNVAWCMPGGTIGNINERNFFTALAAVAQRGDLFVVAAEALTNTDGDDVRNKITSKYNIPEVKRFVEAPIRAVWHELGFKGRIEDVLRKVKPRLVQGEDNPHSAVPRAETVELSLDVNRSRVVLLTSTRYHEAEFERFAATFGFQLLCTVASPRNQRYKQFVYRFEPSSR